MSKILKSGILMAEEEGTKREEDRRVIEDRR